MKSWVSAVLFLAVVAVAYSQDFNGFEGFDESTFDGGNFGNQDLGNFEGAGGFDGFAPGGAGFGEGAGGFGQGLGGAGFGGAEGFGPNQFDGAQFGPEDPSRFVNFQKK